MKYIYMMVTHTCLKIKRSFYVSRDCTVDTKIQKEIVTTHII